MILALAILLVLGLALSLQALRLARRWSRGRAAQVNLAAGLGQLRRAYLGTVHDVMVREPRVARMHALAAGGTLAAVLCVPVQVLTGSALVAGLAAVAAAAGLAGALIDMGRRGRLRPVRLSGGAFDRLPWALSAFNAGLLLSATAVWLGRWPGWAGALLLAAGGGWLVAAAVRGPMRHALAGLTSLVAHPRPERFRGKPATALLPPPDATQPGAGRAEDFAWNRLAMFDACVECGKCEAACPAYAAGQPLNPKALVNDLVRALPGHVGHAYSGHPHPAPLEPERPLDALVPGLGPRPVAAETLWSCTTCRACVEACPMLIEHVDAVIDLRRHETLVRGVPPEGVTAQLLALRETDTLSGRPLADRFDWAADLDLRLLPEGASCDLLLWVGDSAFDLRSQATLRALVRLLHRAGLDIAVLGSDERDCGDFARRTGDEETFAALAAANLESLSRRRIGRIVSADPHVVHCLSREYVALGPMPPVLHHTQLLDDLLASGRLAVPAVAAGAAVTYHDPCYLGRYLSETEAPRRLLERLGLTTVEMADHGSRSRCCGGGGGAAAADIPARRRIPDLRMDQARATGAGVVATACPNCTRMLEGVTGPRPEVRDVAELLWRAVETAEFA